MQNETILFKDFLNGMPPKPRVSFMLEMQKKLEVVFPTIMYWKKTNIIPLYAQNYLLEVAPNQTFDFTPLAKTQTRKNLA